MVDYTGYRPVGVTDEGHLPPRVQTVVTQDVLNSEELNNKIGDVVAPAAATAIGTREAKSTAVRAPGRKGVCLGDSHLESGATSGPTAVGFGFLREALHLAGTFHFDLTTTVNAGIGGNTTPAMLARLDALLDANPDMGWFLLECGSNDADLVGRDVIVWSGYVKQIIEKVRARFSVPIVIVGVPPKEASVVGDISADAYKDRIDDYNTFLRLWCPTQGIEFADIFPELVDPATWWLRTEYANAPVKHINNLGHRVIANILAACLRRMLKTTAIPETAQRKNNLVNNGFMLGAGSTGPLTGLAPGWAQEGTGTAPTWTLEEDTYGLLPVTPTQPKPRWQVGDFQPTSAGDRVLKTTLTTQPSIGDFLNYTFMTLIEDLSGDWEANCVAATANTYFTIRQGASTVIGPSMNGTTGRKIAPGLYLIADTWYRATAATVATGVIAMASFRVPVGSHYKFRVSAVATTNGTQRGINGLV